jgi:hypothetical protein
MLTAFYINIERAGNPAPTTSQNLDTKRKL